MRWTHKSTRCADTTGNPTIYERLDFSKRTSYIIFLLTFSSSTLPNLNCNFHYTPGKLVLLHCTRAVDSNSGQLFLESRFSLNHFQNSWLPHCSGWSPRRYSYSSITHDFVTKMKMISSMLSSAYLFEHSYALNTFFDRFL